ncbi:CDT1-like protein a, chloroplastic [Diospyros lotus]|uniref:CDT1-like protein a, chloroplastic n=1 Tax=Diospyros lotus TaxID=55363 RepID=UPI00225756AB|nr:CDT1-like protein a, chloroplastic [Diospyros lotus]
MASDSSPFDSSKPKPLPSDQVTKALSSERSPWSSKTPEKPAYPPRRLRNCRAAMSVREVREAAAKIQLSSREQQPQPDPAVPDEQQIGSGPCDVPIGKSKRKVDESIGLPQKHQILVRFFDSLDSSIRLLSLKGYSSTFTNISPKVECLTDRRFSHVHLAQLKFILPEVIEIKRILVHDERTSCMKPDLHITMNIDAIKDAGKLMSVSGNSHMRRVFRARLLDFYKANPEGEVPEGTLPEPFNHKTALQTSITKASNSSLHSEMSTEALENPEPVVASHLSQRFQKRFSSKVSTSETVGINQKQSVASLQPSVVPVAELILDQSSDDELTIETAPSSISKFSLTPSTNKNCFSLRTSEASATPSRLPATPTEKGDHVKNEVCSAGTAIIVGTPTRLVSTPTKLMSATPAQQPPKRCYMSPDDNSTFSPNKLFTRPPRSRSLKFDTPVKNAKLKDEVNSATRQSPDNDIFEILPESLLQSIREKERKALEDQDPAISQAKKRKKMIAGLPKVFDMIRFLFQSIKRSIITKEELLHWIMSSHPDIVDRREVEEQLELLQELVPEWIFEKLASSGDLLICINKISSAESIRSRLMEAN